MSMIHENADRIVNEGVQEALHLKMKTAETLEEAARSLREADLSGTGEELRRILKVLEDQVDQLKGVAEADYQNIEQGYQTSVESVEHLIVDHPIPSVLVAAGVGVLMGMLFSRPRN